VSVTVVKVETPVGRLVTQSQRRWHVVTDDPYTARLAIRLSSSDTRERGLAAWRRFARSTPRRPVLLVDVVDGHVERDSREMAVPA
jgi:hypothetical protein